MRNSSILTHQSTHTHTHTHTHTGTVWQRRFHAWAHTAYQRGTGAAGRELHG
jgi:hypothetical protein